jgi:hypothetical protein
MLTLAMPDKIAVDVLTIKNLALLVSQSFYNIYGTRINDVFLTSLKNCLTESSTIEEEEAEKLSTLLGVYLDVAPDLLSETQKLLEQAADQLSFILAASGHGVASGERDNE